MTTEILSEAKRLRLRHLHKQVIEETNSASHKFDLLHANLEEVDVALGLTALIEEVGKLARTMNKLRIAKESDVIQKWRLERDRRFVTTLSLVERLYLTTRERDV